MSDTKSQAAAKEIAKKLIGEDHQRFLGTAYISQVDGHAGTPVTVDSEEGRKRLAAIIAKHHQPGVSDDWAAKYYEDNDQPSGEMRERAEEYKRILNLNKIMDTNLVRLYHLDANGQDEVIKVLLCDNQTIKRLVLDFATGISQRGEEETVRDLIEAAKAVVMGYVNDETPSHHFRTLIDNLGSAKRRASAVLNQPAQPPVVEEPVGGGGFHVYSDEELQAPRAEDCPECKMIGKRSCSTHGLSDDDTAMPERDDDSKDLVDGVVEKLLTSTDVRRAIEPLVVKIAALKSRLSEVKRDRKRWIDNLAHRNNKLDQANAALTQELEDQYDRNNRLGKQVEKAEKVRRLQCKVANDLTRHNAELDLIAQGAVDKDERLRLRIDELESSLELHKDGLKQSVARVTELEGAIRKAQWSGPTVHQQRCTWCGRRMDEGHANDCIVTTLPEKE